MKKILFVCSGNSCRSQMGEGWGRELSDGRFEVNSAGVSPIGVLPPTVATMQEAGVDISEQTSKFLSPELIKWADYIITMCNNARDVCPVFPSNVNHIHWDTENPDRIYLSEEDRKKEFAKVRDWIKNKIVKLYDEID
ncbi:MAG: arsenate reductase ArsC [candidate division Zixibacteria bacterium]|nr:arsenate reductase ArsC [candidate division Zixibacteria bacterium]